MFKVTSIKSLNQANHISGAMISVLTSSAVDRGFVDYKIGICCFPPKHAALRRKSKHGLGQNQDNVSEWGDMSFHGLLFK